MNKYHSELLRELKKHAGVGIRDKSYLGQNYTGTSKLSYSIATPVKIRIVKDWVKKHLDLRISEYTGLLSSLYSGKSHDERVIAGKLLELLPRLRKQLNPLLLKKWLNKAEGWAEVDSICQSSFSAEELLSNWDVWEKTIVEFSKDKNVHKRRASLVLLTKPVWESADPILSKLAFENIGKLKAEKDILITKAISWLLRNLTRHHHGEVKKYVSMNKRSLPSIAVRETRRKLLTGRK